MVTISLCMIVKNESKIIEKTLENILNNVPINYYCISDTGSTDNTIEVIEKFMKLKGIPGKVYSDKWVDFSHNRNKCITYCRNTSDYTFIFDADDSFVGNFEMPKLIEDCYMLKFGNKIKYGRILFIKNTSKWEYEGIIHESIKNRDNPNIEAYLVEGDYYIDSGKFGDRSSDPNKYLNDALLLEKQLIIEKPSKLKSRYKFYCANSYKDHYDATGIIIYKDRAIDWYKKVINDDEPCWIEQKYCSCQMIYKLDPEIGIIYLNKSNKFSKIRFEHIPRMMEYYYKKENYIVVNALYESYKNTEWTKEMLLFQYDNKYMLYQYNALSSHLIGKINSGAEACNEMIRLQQRQFINIKSKYICKLKSNVVITMTTCKRFSLFVKTMDSILTHWIDLHLVGEFIVVDNNSSKEDLFNMKKKYPFITIITNNKDHRESMNIIYKRIKKYEFWVHLEDDFKFVQTQSYIEKGVRGIQKTKCNQILYNLNYIERRNCHDIKGEEKFDEEFSIHVYKPNEKFKYKNSHYWPHFSLRPSIIRVSSITKDFNSNNNFFELDFALQWHENGNKSGFYNTISCNHLGPLTGKFTSNNAYKLNKKSQWDHNSNMYVINLKRRPDRLKEVTKEFNKHQLMVNRFNAFDSKDLKLNNIVKSLFNGNDFNSNPGVIACALSHIELWNKLVNDEKNDYYVIFEDDVTLCDKFRTKFNSIKIDESIIFMGFLTKNFIEGKELITRPLNKDCIGGFHAYIIHKEAVKKINKYITINGVKHGIDYLVMKKLPEICKETSQLLCTAPWRQNTKTLIDTDIQRFTKKETIFILKRKDEELTTEFNKYDFNIKVFTYDKDRQQGLIDLLYFIKNNYTDFAYVIIIYNDVVLCNNFQNKLASINLNRYNALTLSCNHNLDNDFNSERKPKIEIHEFENDYNYKHMSFVISDEIIDILDYYTDSDGGDFLYTISELNGYSSGIVKQTDINLVYKKK